MVRTPLLVHTENRSLSETQLWELFLSTVEKRPDVLSRFQQAGNASKNEASSNEECDIYTVTDVEEHFKAKFTPMLSREDKLLLDVRFTMKDTLMKPKLIDKTNTTTNADVIAQEDKPNGTSLFHAKSSEEEKKEQEHQHMLSREEQESELQEQEEEENEGEHEEKQHEEHLANCNQPAIANEENSSSSTQMSIKQNSRVSGNASKREQSVLVLYFVSPERELTDTTLRNCVYSERIVISDFLKEFYTSCKNKCEQEEQEKREFEENWNKLKSSVNKNKNTKVNVAAEEEKEKFYYVDETDENNHDAEAILSSALQEAVSTNDSQLQHNKTVNDIAGESIDEKNNSENNKENDDDDNNNNNKLSSINVNNTSTDFLECHSEKYVDCTENDSKQSDSVPMQPTLPSMENAILTKYIYTQATNVARKVLKYGRYVAKSTNGTDEKNINGNNNNTNTEQDDKDENGCTCPWKNEINNDNNVDMSYKDDHKTVIEDLLKNEEEPIVATNLTQETKMECNDDNTFALTQSDENLESVIDYSNIAPQLDDLYVNEENGNADQDDKLRLFHWKENSVFTHSKFGNKKAKENNDICENAEEGNEKRDCLKYILVNDSIERKEHNVKEEANIHANEEFVEEYTSEKDRSAREAAIDAEVNISHFVFVHDHVRPLISNPVESNMKMFYDILVQREIINSTLEVNTLKSSTIHESDNKLYDGVVGGSNYVNNNNNNNTDATMCNHNDNTAHEYNEQEEQHKHEEQEPKQSEENDRRNEEDIALTLLSEITCHQEFIEDKQELQAKWKDWRLTRTHLCESKSSTESTYTTTTEAIPVISIIISYNNERIYFDKSAQLLIIDEVDESETLSIKIDSWIPSRYRSNSTGRLSEEVSNLHECLINSSLPDRLTGDNAWYCSHCQIHRDALTQRTIFRLPPILLISFKRFKHTTRRNDKNDTIVHFPTTLDMRPYLDPAANHSLELTQYRLKGVVYHCGQLNCGHYTAIAFNDSIRKWVLYNDETATVWDGDEPKAKNAYILCYERIQPKAIKTDSSPEK